jgi:hypothetical protein
MQMKRLWILLAAIQLSVVAASGVPLSTAQVTPPLQHRTSGIDPQSQAGWRKKFSKDGFCEGHVAEVIPYQDGEFLITCLHAKLTKGVVLSHDFKGKPESAPQPASDVFVYDTPELAAIDALKFIDQEKSEVYEYGGAIGKLENGKFIVSYPNTNYSGDNVAIDVSQLPAQAKLVATYHTHPCIPKHKVQFFSPEDLYIVIFGRLDEVFMGDFCSGIVHEFKYGDKPDETQLDEHVWSTAGRNVGVFTTHTEDE